MAKDRKIPILLTAGLLGMFTAYAISTTFYRHDLNSLLDRSATFSLLTLGCGAFFLFFLPTPVEKLLGVPTATQLWGIGLAVVSAIFFSINLNIKFLIPLTFIGFLLIAFTFSSFDRVIRQKRVSRLVLAWALSGLVSFFLVGFLRNFYPSLVEFLLGTALISIILSVLMESTILPIASSWKNSPAEKIIPGLVLVLGFGLIVLTARLLLRYPTYSSLELFLIPAHLIPLLLGTLILSLSWFIFIIEKLDFSQWQASPLFFWLKRNLPGLLLAFTITASTYLLATSLVRYDVAFMDIFFQTDSPWWLNYLTLSPAQMQIMRAVHPFVLLILRPPIWLISLFLHGEKYYAALLLNTMTGGLCVFVAWLFFKRRTGSTAYSLLLAALLGLSNSHLVLSSLLESYIFSAAALIIFLYLLQSKEDNFPQLVLVGLITFGITITNFAQTCIGFFLLRPDKKNIFKYVLLVLAIAAVLAFIQSAIFPKSDPFYIVSRFQSETFNIDSYSDLGTNATKVLISRMNVTFRNITLFSVVAPRPIIRYDEPHCNPLCFRVMRYFRGEYQYGSYIGFGSLLARIWFLGLIVASLLFAWQFFNAPRQSMLQATLVLNLLFNFALHIKYGDDPLLYTPDWTYALVFFFGISFERFANRKWWQIILLLFLVGLLINNLNLFKTIFDGLLPFFS